MLLVDYTQRRLRSFISEIDRLLGSDFPYTHSKDALTELRQCFAEHITSLSSLEPRSDPAIVRQNCLLILRDFFIYLPLLGFILRSTDVRNAFETFRPLLRLARKVMEPGTPDQKSISKLLISSEWDYSPLVYHGIPYLPGYVLIGFPAHESGNPLVVPLAGHEFGHAVWIREKLADRYKPLITTEVVKIIKELWKEYSEIFRLDLQETELTDNLFAVESWTPAVEWSLRQAEESFCDYFGLAIFRESFLRAFAYLLSPSLGIGNRPVYYPSLKLRAERLADAANKMAIDVDGDYSDLFEEDSIPAVSRADAFCAQVADKALTQVLTQLYSEAKGIVERAGLEVSTNSERDRIVERFRNAVPAENCTSITAILNAGWVVFSDEAFWPEGIVQKEKRDEVLWELVLKNLEIFEIEHIKEG